MASWVIVGAGYTGGALARRQAAEGHEVVATRRQPAEGHEFAATRRQAAETVAGRSDSAPASPATIQLDLARPSDHRFPGAIVVCCAPPGPDPAAEMTNLVALGGERIVYVSSTGVYAPGGGAWVDETWPLAPTTASGRARLAAETALLAASGTATASTASTETPPRIFLLRAAGIYGPGRGLVERIRAGTYRIIGDGRAHVSRIHVDDLVEAIVRAGISTTSGAFNVADDDPAPIGEVADAVAAHYRLPPPPRVPASSVDREIAGMLSADRRIANGRMKRELGVVLRYPSWRSYLPPRGS